LSKILVADDELGIRNLLKAFLVKQGYSVVTARDGQEALQEFYGNNDLSLAIIDVMMPKKDGYSVCREIKKESDLPVIILTAKSAEEDEISAFDCGANDFISKPFSYPVLMRRIKVLLNKSQFMPDKMGVLSINRDTHTIFVNDVPVTITPKEYAIINFLLNNQKRVLTRQQIAEEVWMNDAYVGDVRNIDTHIKNIRQKLGPIAGSYIKTIRGTGYRMTNDF
jgi:DNA-binding response OmpR family regulator